MTNQHHYRICGLNYVWLENGYRTFEHDGEPGTAYHDADGLHDEIAATLIADAAPMRGMEVAFLRSYFRLQRSDLDARYNDPCMVLLACDEVRFRSAARSIMQARNIPVPGRTRTVSLIMDPATGTRQLTLRHIETMAGRRWRASRLTVISPSGFSNAA